MRVIELQVEEQHIEVAYKAMKNIRLRVCAPAGQVRVSAPRHVRQEVLQQFLHSRLDWIREHQQRIRNHPQADRWQPMDKNARQQYREQLEAQLPALIARYETALKVSVHSVSFRHMKTRWGTCNTRRRHICFNLELAKRAPAALEYVVAHELVHLREAGHNKRFYALLDEVMPDWRTRKALLEGRLQVHHGL